MKTTLLALMLMSFGVAFTAVGQQSAISLDKFTFNHPMTVINKVELAIVKKRIADKTEPQATAFAKLVSDADAAQSFKPDPPDTMNIMGGYTKDTNQETIVRPWLWRNGHAAYCSALAYAYTGKTNYAEKAAEILNAWAAKDTTFTNSDRGLQLGSWFSQMLYAADLLHEYPGWKPADRKRFEAWWRAKVLPYTRQVMVRRDNNWKDAGMLGVMSAAVVFEDKLLLQEALMELQSYFEDGKGERTKTTGPWKIKKDNRGVYLSAEVVRNDGRSGVTYTGYSLTTMVQALEIARYTGNNLWYRKTSEGATLQDVIEWYFRWDILKQPFPWNSNPDHFLTRRNPHEIANNHFKLMPEIGDWLKKNRPVNGEQGDEYVTLNKGDIPASGKP